MSVRLSCVILNYNDAETTEKLVKQIADYNVLHQIIVVDNASTDDSLERLKKLEADQPGRLHVLSADHNGGYGSGNNLGVRYAAGQGGATHVLIANPDVVFSEQSLEAMLSVGSGSLLHKQSTSSNQPCRTGRRRCFPLSDHPHQLLQFQGERFCFQAAVYCGSGISAFHCSQRESTKWFLCYCSGSGSDCAESSALSKSGPAELRMRHSITLAADALPPEQMAHRSHEGLAF